VKTWRLGADIAPAIGILHAGGLVAVPTETVYGLAGDGLNCAAVEQIYEVKGRPAVKPLSLMVSCAADMKRYCEEVPPAADVLAERFWPGPLTIVLKAKNVVPEIVRAGGTTVGLRCPDHALTLELLQRCGCPLAAPSANPSGAPSPKTAIEVLDYFDGRIEAVIDGGACGIGKESTIVDLSQTPYRILRRGALSDEDVFGALTERLNVIGITGGTGCGKTTALHVLQEHGALVIDCDAVYHELLETDAAMLQELDARFPGVVRDGKLQRKTLGAVVFADAKALADLNVITHKYVDAEVARRLTAWAGMGGETAAIDAIALFESGLDRRCRCTIGVTAPVEARIARLMAREGITRDYAELRIAAQHPNTYFEQNCDYILENDSTREVFRERCENLLKELI
jgi:tRNA threonylcarbamoyl adenosine modification protein (Sua5/YciO/YrdC/YwlC family)/dephospho-CoA kinase